MNKGDDFVKEVLRRRGQSTVFDVHRPMRPPKTIGGRRLSIYGRDAHATRP